MTDPKGRGRYSSLTKEIHESVLSMIRACASLTEAGEAVGVARSTIWAWHAQGARDEKNDVESPHREFFEAIRLEKAKRSVHAKARMIQLAKKHVLAADRIMQITDPTTIPQVRIHVTNELTTAIDSLEEAFADDPDQPITRREALELARAAILGEYLPTTAGRNASTSTELAGVHSEGDAGVHETESPDAVDQRAGEDSGG
jgi:hypothetical protein